MSESSNKVTPLEIEKQRMKIKIQNTDEQNTSQANEVLVKKVVKNMEKMNKNNDYKSMLKDDLNKQNETFKERLEKRKQKKLLRFDTSTIKEENSELDSSIVDHSQSHSRQKSMTEFTDVLKTANYNSEKIREIFESNPINDSSIKRKSKTRPLSLDIDVINKSNITLDKSQDYLFEEGDTLFSIGDESSISINEVLNFINNAPLLSKYSNFADELLLILNLYYKDLNDYFIKHAITRCTDKLEKVIQEKFSKYQETSRIYQNQIKEMEFLMNEDDQHKESINMIIDSLKDERNHEIDRMNLHYQGLAQDYINDFKAYGISNDSGIQLINEKFKLDLINLISSYLVPVKKHKFSLKNDY